MNHVEALRKINVECHPCVRRAFVEFYSSISTTPGLSIVRPFEILRTPQRQNEVLAAGASKVGGWRSVHQYGCAIDFVPFMGGKFTWDWDGWSALHAHGRRFGIVAPIEWDKPHMVPLEWRRDLRLWLQQSSFT